MSLETRGALLEALVQARLENRRLRISQLRRMVNSINGIIERALISAETEDEYDRKKRRMRERFARFARACLAEIERLRALS